MMRTKNNRFTIGILAAVDAGKTTLSESILYKLGITRSLGRVDHQSTFLDTEPLEKARGITIFSKQAVFTMADKEFTLIDTPGHSDFSAETERILQVLDYAVLVLSGKESIPGSFQILWNLLERYDVPAFIFINKMDQDGADKNKTINDLERTFKKTFVDFSVKNSDFYEKIALTDENLLNEFLKSGKLTDSEISQQIKNRNLFPCFSGSALKEEGIDELLEGIGRYTEGNPLEDKFGAKVFKITRDDQGNRLTHLKITGGSLAVKDFLGDEKVNQIRIYNGKKYNSVNIVNQGEVCAITGPVNSYAGKGYGIVKDSFKPILDTVLTYSLILPGDLDIHKAWRIFSPLNEELPELHISIDSDKDQLQVNMMGKMQQDILKNLIKERFNIDVDFGEGKVLYKETITKQVEGVGHFEPLRHYAEVHLILTPLERGSGLIFETECSEDLLDKNWQRLIMTHLHEKEYTGPLINAPVTDMKVTLVSGKAHQKHTEGGDFREATYRAFRQGLRKGETILLEPYYSFRLELPDSLVGRGLSDIDRLCGKANPPETISNGRAVISGIAPVSTIRNYYEEVVSYTKGQGSLTCIPDGYYKCHNEEEVINESFYDPDRDMVNPADSVFCKHGAGELVPWQDVEKYMHIPLTLKDKKVKEERPSVSSRRPIEYSEEELRNIFLKTYGISKRDRNPRKKEERYITPNSPTKPLKKSNINNSTMEEILLVDGYNMIFAWDELKEMSEINLETSRELLIEALQNYQGYLGSKIILVFDAYKKAGSVEKHEMIKNLEVVYTKEGEIADQYIERYVHDNIKNKRITVATSDGLEQMMVFGQGALRMPARELRERIILANDEVRKKYIGKKF